MAKARTKEDWDKAYRLYLEIGSYNKVAETVDIPFSTLRARAIKEKWKADRDEKQLAIASDPKEQEKYLQVIVQDLGLNVHDAEVLKNIKGVEGICMAAIKGIKGQIDGVYADLVPETFKDATAALKLCWDARDKLLSRAIGTRDGKAGKGDTNVQINFLQAVKELGENPIIDITED